MAVSRITHGKTSKPAAAPSTAAQVESRRALRYEAGADVDADRPGHVRAGSGCAFVDVPGVGRRLAVVQDDCNFIALVDVNAKGSAGVSAVALPAGPGGLRQFDSGRGNKAHKLDLESVAGVVVDGAPALLAMGSGSTAARQVFALVRFSDRGPLVEVFSAAAFFKGLQAPAFAGDELNVEGLVVDGDRVRFFQRGNGAGVAQDAVAEVSLSALLAHLRDPLLHAAPPIKNIRAFDLGAVDGTRLTFTDATMHPDGRTLFLAAAEASPNTYDDGEVKGCAVGVIGADGTVRVAPVLDEKGQPLLDKVEGITVDPSDPTRAWVVVDKDDAGAPAELLRVRLPR